MKRFLRETWELWYWAAFCPEKLQKRMDNWAPNKKEKTNLNDILLYPTSLRFLGNFFCLTGVLSLSLIPSLLSSTAPVDWLFFPIVLIISYSLALISLPVGINAPLLIAYLYNVAETNLSSSLAVGISKLQTLIPITEQLFLRTGICIFCLGFICVISYQLLKSEKITFVRLFFPVGITLTMALLVIPINDSNLVSFFGIIALWGYLYIFRKKISNKEAPAILTNVIATIVSIGIANLSAFLVTGGVAFLVAGGVSSKITELVIFIFSGIVSIGVTSSISTRVSYTISFVLTEIITTGISLLIRFLITVSIIFTVSLVITSGVSQIFRVENSAYILLVIIFAFISFVAYTLIFKDEELIYSLFGKIAIVGITAGVLLGIVLLITGKASVEIAFGFAIGTFLLTVVGIVGLFMLTILGATVGITLDAIANILIGCTTGLITGGIAGIFTGGITGIVTGGIAGILTGISDLILVPFILVAVGVAFSFSYTQQHLWPYFLIFVFISLGFESLGSSVLWVVPFILIFYYRLLPEYPLLAIHSFISRFTYSKRIPFQGLVDNRSRQSLRWLPPFVSEIVWFPLPGHAQLLAEVFKEDTELGLRTLQTMQSSQLPGLTFTAQKAMPDVIADQLLKHEKVSSLIAIAPESANTQSTDILQILLPTYYGTSLKEDRSQQFIKSDIKTLFPRLQEISQDVNVILRANSYALRERGLERILDKLNSLKLTLPGLGLKSNEIKRWQPVITHWQHILELELKQQKKLSQGELLNPFQYGNPIKCSQFNLFKGRKNFADNIVRLLLDHNRPTIILHGPRRCGKTSFLKNLPRLLPSSWVPIFIDIQSSAATADEVSFLRSLARAVYRDSRSQGLHLPTVPERSDFLAAPYDIFETWLEIVLDQLPDRQLLLNLDEFDKVGTAINQGKLSLTLFDELRSLIQHWNQLGFIFSGVQTLDEIGPNWSSYFISVVPVEMLYLEPDEARDLLTNPDPEFALTYKSGLVDTILEITQCHPNLLQLIGAALVTEANEHHNKTATADMLETAIPRAFTLGTSYFTNVWTEFTGDPTKPDEIRAGQIALKALTNGNQPTASDTATKAALRRMVRYHVLKENNGQYEFDIPLIKRWVKERAILDDFV